MHKQALLILTLVILFSACGGGSNETPPNLNIPTNSAPTANDDSIEIFINENVLVGILTNDVDIDGNALTVTAVTTPASGVVQISNNEIAYTPSANFIGTDTFSYTIQDSVGAESTAIVQVTIINRPPIATNDISSTQQSSAIQIDVLSNDSSAGNHDITVVSLSEPSNGLLSLDTNIVTYQPLDGYVGQDSFVYTVRDSLGDESTASVLVTVSNVQPVSHEDLVTIEQNTVVTIDVLDNDLDVKGDTLSISGNTLPKYGTLSLQDNVFIYTPNDGYSGFDQFDYTVVDNFAGSSQATVTINVSNLLPIANPDEVVALEGIELEIDVLANDSDVNADSLTIQSVGQPQNGSASIVENKIYYQPSTDFIGSDLLGYTIVDNYGASASSFIQIDVIAGLIIRGKVVGQDVSDLDVSVYTGEVETNTTTNEQGVYEVTISTLNEENLIRVNVSHPSAEYVYKAYFDDIKTLLEIADSNYLVEELNLSELTTAEFELLEGIRGTSEIDDLTSLYAYRAQLKTLFQLEGAVASMLIIEDNEISLPVSFTSINTFLQSTLIMREQLSLWRELYPSEYYAAFNRIFESDELSSFPDGLEQGNFVFQYAASSDRLFYSSGMAINADGEGHFLRSGRSKNEFSWTTTDNYIVAAFSEAASIFGTYRTYCGSSSNTNPTFTADSVQFRQLYSTSKYDVFVVKNTGTFDDSDCFDSDVHTTNYNTVSLYKPEALSIAPGEYYFESFRLNLPEEDTSNSDNYSIISALFNLAEDGSFIETIDAITAQRSGQWSVVDNSLVLDYLNDFVVSYQLVSNFDGLDVMSYQVLDDSILAATSHTFIVPKDDSFSVDNTSGFYSSYQNASFDQALDTLFGLNFTDGGSGVQRNFSNSNWQDSGVSVYSWELVNNKYVVHYYYDITQDITVDYCDDSVDECSNYRQRSFEVIGKRDNYYIVKNYQEATGEYVFGAPFRSGYIGLFSFADNE
jgi:hypothetical protein